MTFDDQDKNDYTGSRDAADFSRNHSQNRLLIMENSEAETNPAMRDPKEHYPGGKGGAGVYQKIINQMPPHVVYVEAFLGNGSILKYKKPALKSIGIELDRNVFARWRGDEIPDLGLINADALLWLRENQSYLERWRSLVYCDPPYLFSTRRQQSPIYLCELEDEKHLELLEIIKSLNCLVMISGYQSEMYDQMLEGWRREEFTTSDRGGNRRTESLWCNFPEPMELHDYSFLGENFTDRQRIKRKRARWKTKLLNLSRLERLAVMSAIDELKTNQGS